MIIDFDAAAVSNHAETAALSAVTIAELAYGLHTADVMVNANRQARYRWILSRFDVVDFDTEVRTRTERSPPGFARWGVILAPGASIS